MLRKALYSLAVAVVVILVCVILGALLKIVPQETIQSFGTFLQKYAGLIGILGGFAYFVWGPVRT